MPHDIFELSQMSAEMALQFLHSSWGGLSAEEAQNRLEGYGTNEIKSKRYRSIILEALSHSTNPLVAILMFAAVVSAFTGNLANAVIIILVITVSIFLDFFQSHRSLLVAEKLQNTVAQLSKVFRDGKEINLPSKELVQGDVIKLVAGDMVPADCRLLNAKDLHVQQAVLTGESLAVEKDFAPLPVIPTNPAAANNAVFAGSSIVSGYAIALVVSTGLNSLVGQIAKELTKTSVQTEFERGMLNFGLFIMKTIFFLVLFVFVINFWFGHSPIESLLFAMALAVGLTPEFLPMITTVTLATGALRMSKQKVVVKHLTAIQNFGSIDILCCDKTGTLTENTMTLEQSIDLTGNNSEQVMLLAYLNSLYGTGIKNPIDIAILENTKLNPLDEAILRHHHPDITSYNKVDEIPFDFERRRSSVVVDKGDVHWLITKGAPEQILQLCTFYMMQEEIHPLKDSSIKKYRSLFNTLSQDGYRVLAVAYRQLKKQQIYQVDDEKDLVLAGFLTFLDPPLKDSSQMINDLKRAGIQIKILTGDNELVTRHVCSEVGLSCQDILVGEQMEHISSSALTTIAEQTHVFARLSPQQKLMIIQALRAKGHVVGFLGDGINDAPSLRASDVGISVADAVDVAKEAADIILLEHNLKVLLNGIFEGRKSFGNVMKYLMMGTSSNFGNMLSMAFIAPFLPFFPMRPTQILINNLLYDVSQLTIPTDKVDDSFLQKPKKWNITIVKRFMFYIGPISSLFDFVTFFVMLKVFHASESLFQSGWFLESLATQILVIFIIRTAKNPFKSPPSLPLTMSVLAALTLAIVLPFSPIAPYLGLVPLPWGFFVFLVLATASYLLLVELVKRKLMWNWFQDLV
nr:magnesium-translocating P-type ATPase [Legionella jordanis]